MASRSRKEKEHYTQNAMGTAEDISVRLFAFSISRAGYQPCFSPETPFIVLKAKKAAAEEHPCKQWEPLARLLYRTAPNTAPAAYVVDATPFLATRPQEEHEESVNGLASGPLLKRIGNVIVKLNPHNATLIASGASSFLALKYALSGERQLGHPDRYCAHVVLLHPPDLAPLRALTTLKARRETDGYPAPRVTVVVRAGPAEALWAEWLRECAAQGVLDAGSTVSCAGTAPPAADATVNPLFADVLSAAGVVPDGGSLNTMQSYEVPQVFRIDFVQDKREKMVVQVPVPSPLDTLGHDDPSQDTHHHHHCQHSAASESDDESGSREAKEEGGSDDDAHEEWEDEVEEEEQEGGACGCGHDHGHSHNHHHRPGNEGEGEGEGEEDEEGGMLVPGLNELQFTRAPFSVVVEGRVLDIDRELLGTMQGRVHVSGLKELLASQAGLEARARRTKGMPVTVVGRVCRDADGRSSLEAAELAPMTKMEVEHSVMAGDDAASIPEYNVSAVAHHCGGIIMRGRKCILVRELCRPQTLFLPEAPHDSDELTSLQCAIATACNLTQVSEDNFHSPSYLPPVVYYEPAADGGGPVCVTLYPLLCNYPPPGGPASDAVEDKPEPEEPYDWLSYEAALRCLKSEAQREALTDMAKNLARATRAGLHKPFPGCGIFGDPLGPGVASANAKPKQ